MTVMMWFLILESTIESIYLVANYTGTLPDFPGLCTQHPHCMQPDEYSRQSIMIVLAQMMLA